MISNGCAYDDGLKAPLQGGKSTTYPSAATDHRFLKDTLARMHFVIYVG